MTSDTGEELFVFFPTASPCIGDSFSYVVSF